MYVFLDFNTTRGGARRGNGGDEIFYLDFCTEPPPFMTVTLRPKLYGLAACIFYSDPARRRRAARN
jgi:hypothetical protein